MKALKHVMLVAAIVAIPTLSFAQQTNTPANGTASAWSAPATTPDTQHNQASFQYQQATPKASGAVSNSGYGAPAAGSSQSSTTPFVGKHSPVFNH